MQELTNTTRRKRLSYGLLLYRAQLEKTTNAREKTPLTRSSLLHIVGLASTPCAGLRCVKAATAPCLTCLECPFDGSCVLRQGTLSRVWCAVVAATLRLNTKQLGALFVKQISKPLAGQLKRSAVEHPVFSSWLTALGQRMHEANAKVSHSLKTDTEVAARRVFITKLDDSTAMKQAADFLGEARRNPQRGCLF